MSTKIPRYGATMLLGLNGDSQGNESPAVKNTILFINGSTGVLYELQGGGQTLVSNVFGSVIETKLHVNTFCVKLNKE